MAASSQEPSDRPSLIGAYLRHARAEEHIGHITEEIAFFVDKFDVIPKKARVKQGESFNMGPITHKPGSVRPSAMISVYLGEAIYNLRAALDYLVYELAWLDSGEIQQNTQFPIEKSAELFQGRRTGHYIEHESGEEAPETFLSDHAGRRQFDPCGMD